MSEYGLLINYEYCTGCHTCEVACKLNKHLPLDAWGIKILQDGPRQNPDGSWEYNYLPMPTSLCNLCAERVSEGRLPSCVHHCQSGCMYFDTIDELAKLAIDKPRSVIFRLAPQPDLEVKTFVHPPEEKRDDSALIETAYPHAEEEVELVKTYDERGFLIIPQTEVNKAWDRCGGTCECGAEGHDHDGVCGKVLNIMMQGGMNPIGWEAVAIDQDGEPSADNCMIICRTCLNALGF